MTGLPVSERSGAFPSVIVKRDNSTTQTFDVEKIRRAITAAWSSCLPNPDVSAINQVITTAMVTLRDSVVGVEKVQDAIETALMYHQRFDVAKAYILYRHEHAEKRLLRGSTHPDPKAVSDYIHASKYARYLPHLSRREIYEETVTRVETMHLSQHPHFAKEIRWAFDLVREKKLLPSMRSLQFGGAAMLANHNRGYNCAFTHVDRLDVFSEAFFLLLSGCGVGYSIQFQHVEKLPPIKYIDKTKVRHHVILDTIEGWADGIKALLQSYQDGTFLELSYHLIRAAGTPLVTSGGRAPGHQKLKESIERVRTILDGAQGRQLRPVECHHIFCHIADAVLSGGIRRSAMIAFFSLDDSEMLRVKTGSWILTSPWLANANNSVMLLRSDVREAEFKRIFKMTKEWGEPGFYFTDDLDYGSNPCVEIGLFPKLAIDVKSKERLAARGIHVEIGDVYTGWAFCNLCEINAAKFTSLDDFLEAAHAATIIGTLQATYTKMPYLGWVSECLAERESLLGISMTGMLDAPEIACHPVYQTEVALKIKEWNATYAAILGIEPAARTTCNKPSGTTSLALGCVASGHHAHHARRYLRRVTADSLELVFQEFQKINPHMCVRKPDGKWVIEFPVEAPQGAIVKSDLDAIQFLEMVKSTQQNWVLPGTAHSRYAPRLYHNVSNTVTVTPEEWLTVADYLWNNRAIFTGVSLLASSGDKDYAFAPNEAITTAADEARWSAILARYVPVDYTTLVEVVDGTNLSGEIACAGGVCLT